MEAKKQIEEIVKNITNDEAEKLLKFINDNLKLIVSEHDRKEIERGRKEIENGEYEFI